MSKKVSGLVVITNGTTCNIVLGGELIGMSNGETTRKQFDEAWAKHHGIQCKFNPSQEIIDSLIS